MGIPPPRWTAADNKEVYVWLAEYNSYYTSPIVASLIDAAWKLERKHEMDMFGKYYFSGYCGFSRVVMRHTDDELRKYRNK